MACSKLMWALQTPWFNLIVAVIMMGLSIYQITGAYGTMKDLNGNSASIFLIHAAPLHAFRNSDIADDFAMIIANWEGQPITEIDVLAAGSTCPSGWTKFPVSVSVVPDCTARAIDSLVAVVCSTRQLARYFRRAMCVPKVHISEC